MLVRALIICGAIQAVLKFTYSQCIGRSPIASIDYPGPYIGYAYDGYRNSPYTSLSSFSLSSLLNSPNGPLSIFGNFPFSKITTTGRPGMSVLSENVVDGVVSVAGRLPFLGTVAVEGNFPTAGSGVVNYNCGGLVAMMNELPGISNIAFVAPSIAPTVAPANPPVVAPVGTFNYPSLATGYDYGYASSLGYSPFSYDSPVTYGSTVNYTPSSLNYGQGSLSYGPGALNYRHGMDGYYSNSFNGYGYGAVY